MIKIMKINIPPFGWLEARKEGNKLIIEDPAPRPGFDIGSVGLCKTYPFRADPFIIDSYEPQTGVIKISDHEVNMDLVFKLLNQVERKSLS